MSNQHFRWRKSADRVGAAILGAFLPQSCCLCGAGSASLLCGPCQDGLPLLDTVRCPVCALPAPGAQVCGACLREPPHFDATQARFLYAFPLDRLLLNYKYARRLILGAAFEPALAAGAAVDAVLAVPGSPAHMRERGFNPALELARPVARRLGVPLLLDACTRPRNAPAQAGLPWKARRKNVKGAFECHADLSGMRIAVVDDVMTTGATLDELARTLKRHGAAYVENRVVARAVADA